MKKNFAIALGLLLAAGTIRAQQYLITTIAGGGLPPTPAPALSSSFPGPQAAAVDSAGNVYFIAENCVFKVSAAGTLTRVAGGSTRSGYSGDGGPALRAQLNVPDMSGGLAVDKSGNIFIADYENSVVREVTTDGTVITVAGNGTSGDMGDGGAATSARLGNPQGVAVDAAGSLYIADAQYSVVRKVTNGIITTVAGSNADWGYSGDGGPATSAQLKNPSGVAVDAAGNLYIADPAVNVIRKVTPAGTISTFAGNATQGYSGDNGQAVKAQLYWPSAVAVDTAGNLFITDRGDGHIRKVTPDGTITTFAGTGGEPFGSLSGLALDATGNLYVTASASNLVLKVTPNGAVSTIAGTGGSGGGWGYSGDGGPATAAQMGPFGAAPDASGNLFIADTYNNVIRKVASNGIITTVAGTGAWGYSGDGNAATGATLASPFWVAPDPTGNLFIADTSNNVVRRVTPAGTITTWVAASVGLRNLQGLAVNSSNLFIADTGNNVIREAPSSGVGIIGTVGGNANLHNPGAVAVDSAGNLFIADTGDEVIRKITPDGAVSTVAGGGTSWDDGIPATSAELGHPQGVAVDASGNVFIADTQNLYIRKVGTDGIIKIVAGLGRYGYSGDGGPASAAMLQHPETVAVDAAGNVWVADSGSYAIRVLVPAGTRALLRATVTASSGSFSPGQTAATYSVVVSNATGAGATTGTVTVTEILPTGLTLVETSGAGWSCSNTTCTRSDALNPGSSYPALTITVNVAADAPSQVTNQISVSGGGSLATGASDTTNISATAPQQPVTLLAPPNGLVGVATMPTLSWSAFPGAAVYDVFLGTATWPPYVAGTTGTTYAPPALITGITYYWRVVAINGDILASSPVWSFTTGGPEPPSAPALAWPYGGATGVTVTPELSWNAAPGATSYDVYFGPSATPPFLGNTNGIAKGVGTLLPGTTYYWNVVARNSAGTAASVTLSFTTASSPPVGLRFVPVTPCRVADTRNASGPFGGPTPSGGGSRSFIIPQSACGIPATAQAYSLNVTAVPKGRLSYLTLWPTGQQQPFVSTLNSFQGDVVANAAIVPAGANGAVSVFVTDPADVILDINGYFDTSNGANSFSFYPATPCRVVDTRAATGQFGGPSMHAQQSRDFPVPLGPCAIPSTARAYSLNATVVPAGYLGYLSAWPTGQAQPLVSTLNSWKGKVVANAAIVPAGTNESISVYVTNPTEVILDIDGYFAAQGSANGLSFYPLPPCRVVDTRNADAPLGGPEMNGPTMRSFAITASACNVPSLGVAAYSLNVTVVPDGPLSYLTIWPFGLARPYVSTLNSWDGAVVANAAIVPAASAAISVYVTSPTHVILDINGYFAP